jgi:hypothetical protein
MTYSNSSTQPSGSHAALIGNVGQNVLWKLILRVVSI